MEGIMPTLSVLHKRYPETYKSDLYIVCYKEVKTLEHLMSCDIYNIFWKRIEERGYKANGDIEDENKCKMRNTYLKLILGSDIRDKYEKRKLVIQGLVPAKKGIESMKERRVKCEIFETINGEFFEKIQNFRCEVVAEWEEKNHIEKPKKRKREDNLELGEEARRRKKKKKPKENSGKEVKSSVASDKENKKEEKENEKERWHSTYETVKQIFQEWIQGFSRPAWLSLGKERKIN